MTPRIGELLAVFGALGPLAACRAAEHAPKKDTASRAAVAQAPVVRVGERGFEPSTVRLGVVDERRHLAFERVTDQTCATSVIFPELHIERPLPLNQVVDIELPVGAPTKLTFQCGMGMYKGKVVARQEGAR